MWCHTDPCYTHSVSERGMSVTDVSAEPESSYGPICEGVTVKLIGENGNAYNILGRVRKAMLRADVPQETIDAYLAEATAGDYNHLLSTTMKYVDVE